MEAANRVEHLVLSTAHRAPSEALRARSSRVRPRVEWLSLTSFCSCVWGTCCPSGSVLGTGVLSVSHTDQPPSSGAWSIGERQRTLRLRPGRRCAMGEAGRAAGSGQAGLLGKVGVHPREEGHLSICRGRCPAWRGPGQVGSWCSLFSRAG